VDRRHDHALMPLDFLLDRMSELPAFDALAAALPRAGQRVGIGGLPGSSPAVLVAALARRFPQRVLTIVAPTPADAERWLADLEALAPEAVALYPQRESLGGEEQHVEIAGERIETVAALLEGRIRILITTARATVERTGVPGALRDARLTLSKGGGPTLGDVAERLVRLGYAKVPTVTEVGQFSVRGGILDVYGFGMAAPGRIEWWGDDVATLRGFDLDTQRSGDPVERVTVLPLQEQGRAGAQDSVRSSLLELLPSDALLVVDRESPVRQEVDRTWTEAAHHLEVSRRLGEEPEPREVLFLAPDRWESLLGGFARLAPEAPDATVRFPISSPELIDRDLKYLRRLIAGPTRTVILCDNEGQLERLEELLDSGNATLAVGALDGGFVFPGLRVLTDHEIFRRARRLRRARRYRAAG
jgi:transcription-repair coupling factor (superfamily II helicase)